METYDRICQSCYMKQPIKTHNDSRGRSARTLMVPVSWLFCRYLRTRKQVNLECNQYQIIKHEVGHLHGGYA